MNHPLPIYSSSPVKASDIIGTHVVNLRDEKLGDIKEIVIDPQSGKVAYAVVAFGGFMSMGEKLFAVPFGAFKYNVGNNEYLLDASREHLKDAPGFDADKWPSMVDEAWIRDVHRYYDRAAYH